MVIGIVILILIWSFLQLVFIACQSMSITKNGRCWIPSYEDKTRKAKVKWAIIVIFAPFASAVLIWGVRQVRQKRRKFDRAVNTLKETVAKMSNGKY